MPTPTTSKRDLEDKIHRAIEVLDDANDVASSRQDLADALTGALEILRGEDEEDLDDEEASDDEE
jgi:hypothetical protein